MATLSSIGLPLLNGFIGEFLVLLGAFEYNYKYAAIGATGIILGAVYMLWAYQKVMLGPLENPENKNLKDASAREIIVFLPLAIMMFVMGIYPKPFLERMEPSVEALLKAKYPKQSAVVINQDERQPSDLPYLISHE